MKLKKRLRCPPEANPRLPSTVTLEFISDFQQLLNSRLSEVKFLYQRELWLTKYCEPNPKMSTARRVAAIEKWLSTEARMFHFNDNFSRRWYEPIESLGCTFGRLVEEVAEMVHGVLGDSPKLDVAYAAYSGGASTSKRRTEGHPALKFLGKADMTPDCANLLPLLEETAYGRYLQTPGLEPRLVDSSVLFTVPKSSEIDRVACKEPDLNVYFQKMFGGEIRRRLRYRGINLNDQGINGFLAKEGSETGHLATIDLSSASDSVSYALVEALLPPQWFYHLLMARTPRTILPNGSIHTLSMFSSMGNGFTFELESLIFYCLARAVARRAGIKGRISVYGDDIIMPSTLMNQLTDGLTAFGFLVNRDKSFHEGPFRESCGYYWHEGIDVKPFYLRQPLTRLSDLIQLLNAMIAWSSRGVGVVDPEVGTLWKKYAGLVPTDLWGGQDLTSGMSLVTGDRPRKRLKPASLNVDCSHIGGYLLWLQSTANRRFVTDQVRISDTVIRPFYRLKRNRDEPADLPAFTFMDAE